ncbi:HAD-IIB family hydrolase [bacterium]|nr:HAD-IIB family hydrolase [candidate division CSSED10-310 bacterium]
MNRQTDPGPESGLYIAMLSIHGLVRGYEMELGRDADTGGQVKYVVELARALAERPDVGKVDLFTRRIIDRKVDNSYSEYYEQISDKAGIIRIDFGPRRYLRKEVLWPYLDDGINGILAYFRRIRRLPDIMHGHYADAGYMGRNIVSIIGTPLAFTGHSLGKVKKKRLLNNGMNPEKIEKIFRIDRRIQAEETALSRADLVITSTRQEIEEQYLDYGNFKKHRARVIPPGMDLDRFRKSSSANPAMIKEITRFWITERKPIILAISRPDTRKNITALIHAYASSVRLKEKANLLLVVGNRDDFRTMEPEPKRTIEEILWLVDKYNLYGHVSIPKHHRPEDIPGIYRLAAKSRGVFVNPALTEPFGLTLIEAAASGLPVVTTNDGGPRDIIANCKNGLLVDPMKPEEIGNAVNRILSDDGLRRQFSKCGIRNVGKHYTWTRHTVDYLENANRILKHRKTLNRRQVYSNILPTIERLIICDLDNALLGDPASLRRFFYEIESGQPKTGLGIATGRRIEASTRELNRWSIKPPVLLITSVGTEIYYGSDLTEDVQWSRFINNQWEPERIREIVRGLPGIALQPKTEQRRFKISFFIDRSKSPKIREIKRILMENNIKARLIHSFNQFLDVLPVRASKGTAIRYVANKWHLPLTHILVAGASGNDRDMLITMPKAVVVRNHGRELNSLKGKAGIYFSEGEYADGIVEGMKHFQFMSEQYQEANRMMTP